jgi:hypothetical protein
MRRELDCERAIATLGTNFATLRNQSFETIADHSTIINAREIQMSRVEGLNGQWFGEFVGSSSGKIIVNIDDRGSYYQGEAYMVVNVQGPSLVALFRIPDTSVKFKFRTDLIQWLDLNSGHYVASEVVAKNFPAGTTFSKYADVEGSYEKNTLTLAWTTDIGTTGTAVLPRSKAGEPSTLPTEDQNWQGYKDHVSGLTHKRYLFRGQSGPYRLRTSFHRSGRANLWRFLNEDVVQLHRNLSARTKHFFNLQIPDENGAFLNLVQHHGYPTPLLDWTYSPYVAAFFAYRSISREGAAKAAPGRKVRILILDQEQWRNDWLHIPLLNFPGLNFSIGEFVSVENERMIPQQAATTITNADDIESYVQSKQEEKSGTTRYLRAIDLPIADRNRVLEELRYMGITAGSMFPGLDGACEELKQRNFDL